jgi:glucosyl-3-phosphoglycerate synthase
LSVIQERRGLGVDGRAEAWLRRRTSHWRDWPAGRLLEWKQEQGTRISVVIPARDEEATVGEVVGAVRDEFVLARPLVDELIVMDSDSADATARVAASAGAEVYRCRDVAPELGGYPGKGEALWKSLLVTTGDIIVFMDADLTTWGSHFVTGLLGPLLSPGGTNGVSPRTPRGAPDERASVSGAQDPGVLLVKACYDRAVGGTPEGGTIGGGRVTELVARPMLNLWWPQLAGVAQPLSGEWAGRRTLLESLPVPVGYGVEIAVLIDTVQRHGVDAIAQVDLGERAHSHQSDADLAVMAAELMLVAERRRFGAELAREPELVQFFRAGQAELGTRARAVPSAERPPAGTVLAGTVLQENTVRLPGGPPSQAQLGMSR